MTQPRITLVAKNYDYLAPLVYGDVVAEGIDLKIDRDTKGALGRFMNDASIEAGEVSFSKHLMRLAGGDRSFVGIPFFAYRAFRQRCFLVRRDSGLTDLRQLEGKRIGTNGWPDTGNTWTRALLREQGVRIDRIEWWVGPIEERPYRTGGSTGIEVELPPYAHMAAPGRTLKQMILEGEVDALMVPLVPAGFYAPDSPIVRLIPDYRRAEQEYYRRTGIYPGHHIFALRREVFDRNPEAAVSLFQALERSKVAWQERCLDWAETSPWFLAELEDATALLGRDWHPNGVEPNRRMLEALCEEEYAQGLTPRKLEVSEIFSEFEEVAR